MMSMIDESSYVRIWLDKGKEEGLIEGKIEGKIEQARAIILRLGRKRIGEPDAETLEKLESIQNVERLEEIFDQMITATSWNESFGEQSIK